MDFEARLHRPCRFPNSDYLRILPPAYKRDSVSSPPHLSRRWPTTILAPVYGSDCWSHRICELEDLCLLNAYVQSPLLGSVIVGTLCPVSLRKRYISTTWVELLPDTANTALVALRRY